MSMRTTSSAPLNDRPRWGEYSCRANAMISCGSRAASSAAVAGTAEGSSAIVSPYHSAASRHKAVPIRFEPFAGHGFRTKTARAGESDEMSTVASEAPDQSHPHRQRAEDVVAALGTDAQRGLTDEEARSRLEKSGPNELATETPVPAWRRFIAQFRNVLVVLLLVATAISVTLWAYERDAALPYEAIAIFAVVL